ncbi:MAG TPA: ATP-dependent helicase C-terminal domain-containing protein [Thermoanaerobaculia bacterium]|nr:ATP-dependent helicase C-terminal domain-containing protein [Thermoanaerobaculia bacterium]
MSCPPDQRGGDPLLDHSSPELGELSVAPLLPRLVAALAAGRAAILTAPPGAGKTTLVPPALLAAGAGGGRQIVMLEPRRLAARAAARRIAEQGGWRVGEEVGYQVRFDRHAGPATRILVVTEGILVQMLQSDPFLSGIGVLIFDEFHERSLAADLALAMARRVQREVRPDLALVAMSATLDAGPLAAFLGGCPIVECAGRPYPVEVSYLDQLERRLDRRFDRFDRSKGRRGASDADQPLTRLVAAAVRGALAATAGDVLVFLPGAGEIERAAAALATLGAEQRLAVMPLYGDLPPARQDEVLRPADRRKVVLATNVAETSITIDGVSAVVDSGLARRLRYDPATGLDRLELIKISRAAAEQRAGRAGRQGPGICLRLWPAHEHSSRPERETPEIARIDLAGPALQLLAWGETDLAGWGWFEAPEPQALAAAALLLARLGATDASGVTAVGRAMARLPVHPRLARLLLEGHRFGVTRAAALLAALLAERDPFPRRPRQRPGSATAAPRSSRSDLLDRLDALALFESASSRSRGSAAARADEADEAHDADSEGLHRAAARMVLRARDQLVELARRELGGPDGVEGARQPERAEPGQSGQRGQSGTSGESGAREEALLRALLAAYPDRLARQREPHSRRALMVGGRGVRLAEESAVEAAELFLCIDVAPGRGGTRAEDLVRLASAVEADWLPAARLRTSVELVYNAERERVTAWKRNCYDDLVLAEHEVAPPDPAAAEALLAAVAAALPHAGLPAGDLEVASFLARLRSLADWMPELGLPRFDDAALRALLPQLAAGKRSLAELRRAPLLQALRGSLSGEQRAALDREAPERLEVPSGSRIRLTYEPGRPPVLAARIQELFGLAETPRIAAGRVAVLLHLLAPSGRPQQLTADLRSFWRNTYPEVRRQLQGRYPRHAWPADPTRARPERRPRRRT